MIFSVLVSANLQCYHHRSGPGLIPAYKTLICQCPRSCLVALNVSFHAAADVMVPVFPGCQLPRPEKPGAPGPCEGIVAHGAGYVKMPTDGLSKPLKARLTASTWSS